jgi:hypothetical protein
MPDLLSYLLNPDNLTATLAVIATIGSILAGTITTGLSVLKTARASWLELDGGPEQESLRQIVTRIDSTLPTIAKDVTDLKSQALDLTRRVEAVERTRTQLAPAAPAE